MKKDVGGTVVDMTPEEIAALPGVTPTKDDVNNERDRRVLLRKTVTIAGIGLVTVDINNGGRQNIGDLGTAAIAKTLASDTSPINFRDADNNDHVMTNAQVIEMGLLVTEQISAIFDAAKALKGLTPIPQDYADNARWP